MVQTNGGVAPLLAILLLGLLSSGNAQDFFMSPGELADVALPPPPPRFCETHIDFRSHFHGFAQSHGGSDSRNWYLHGAATPLNAFLRDSRDPYAYTRFRFPFANGDAGLLVSPLFAAPVMNHSGLTTLVDNERGRCSLEFDFYVKGARLRVFTHDSTATIYDNSKPTWSSRDGASTTTGTQNAGWSHSSISLDFIIDNFLVTFEGVCGVDGTAMCMPDATAAISHVKLSETCCLTEAIRHAECTTEKITFDNGLEGFEQTTRDRLDWTRHFGPAVSTHTGPRADHTSGRGAYMYVESSFRSHPERQDTASLLSPQWYIATNCNVTFWYLMNGKKMGQLEVLVNRLTTPPSAAHQVFDRSGDQGNNWHSATVDLSAYGGDTTVQLEFRATLLASSTTSDIAIDDVQLSSECCGPALTPSPEPNTAIAASPVTVNAAGQNGSQPMPTKPPKKKSHGLSTGVIVAIIAPILVLLVLIIAYVLFRVFHEKTKRTSESKHYKHENDPDASGMETAAIEANEAAASAESAT